MGLLRWLPRNNLSPARNPINGTQTAEDKTNPLTVFILRRSAGFSERKFMSNRGFMGASELPASADCNGKVNAEAPLPRDTGSEAARRGTLIHAALAGIPVDLPDEDIELYYQLLCKRRRIVEQHFPEGFDEEVKEERMHLSDPRIGEKQFSGKPDFIGRSGSKLLVIDYKTGRGHVDSSASNLQLRALAVMAAERFSADVVLVAIIQAYATPEVAAYTLNDLKDAREEVVTIVERSMDPSARRTPSELACKYCKARPICPEARATLQQVASEGMSALHTPEELPKLLDAAEVAQKVIYDIKARALEVLKAGECVEGWEMRQGTKSRSISKPAAFRKKLIDEGLLSDADLASLKITPTEAERIVAKKQGITAGAARKLIAEYVGEYIDENYGSERLSKS